MVNCKEKRPPQSAVGWHNNQWWIITYLGRLPTCEKLTRLGFLTDDEKKALDVTISEDLTRSSDNRFNFTHERLIPRVFMSREYDFSEADKNKCLLWCARHCCLCGKECGVNIEVAHIPGEEESSDIDSAIPLCFDCHAKIGQYSTAHPKGTRYRKEELKPRRDQIYEQYTRHLVPPILASILLHPYGLPRVGFRLANLGDFPWAKARVEATVRLGSKKLSVTGDKHGYYSGEVPWHLNPKTAIDGNFGVPIECVTSTDILRVEINIKIFDIYERPHRLLPFCYTYVRESKDQRGNLIPPYWFLEPTSYENLKKNS